MSTNLLSPSVLHVTIVHRNSQKFFSTLPWNILIFDITSINFRSLFPHFLIFWQSKLFVCCIVFVYFRTVSEFALSPKRHNCDFSDYVIMWWRHNNKCMLDRLNNFKRFYKIQVWDFKPKNAVSNGKLSIIFSHVWRVMTSSMMTSQCSNIHFSLS